MGGCGLLLCLENIPVPTISSSMLINLAWWFIPIPSSFLISSNSPRVQILLTLNLNSRTFKVREFKFKVRTSCPLSSCDKRRLHSGTPFRCSRTWVVVHHTTSTGSYLRYATVRRESCEFHPSFLNHRSPLFIAKCLPTDGG